MKPFVSRRIGWGWYCEELDFRASVRAAQELLYGPDLDAAGSRRLSNVIGDFYLYVETHLPSDERTPTTELSEKEYDHDHT